jgi:hypothetical protein
MRRQQSLHLAPRQLGNCIRQSLQVTPCCFTPPIFHQKISGDHVFSTTLLDIANRNLKRDGLRGIGLSPSFSRLRVAISNSVEQDTRSPLVFWCTIGGVQQQGVICRQWRMQFPERRGARCWYSYQVFASNLEVSTFFLYFCVYRLKWLCLFRSPKNKILIWICSQFYPRE